jgi:hypothetical protein
MHWHTYLSHRAVKLCDRTTQQGQLAMQRQQLHSSKWHCSKLLHTSADRNNVEPCWLQLQSTRL